MPAELAEELLAGEFNTRAGFIAVPNPFGKGHGCRSCQAPPEDIVGYDAYGNYACPRHVSEAFTWAKDGKTGDYAHYPSERVRRFIRAEQFRRGVGRGEGGP